LRGALTNQYLFVSILNRKSHLFNDIFFILAHLLKPSKLSLFMRLHWSYLFVFFILFGSTALGQQNRHFTQYMFAKTAFNPGAAGNSGGICVNAIVRQQWTGFKEAGTNVGPESFMITVDAPFRFLHGALSGTIIQDQMAYWKDVSVNLGYTYTREMGRGILGAGMQIEFVNRSIDFSKLEFVDSNEPIIAELSGEQSDMLFDFAFGVYYEVPDSYYLGISTFDVLQSNGKELGTDGSGQSFKYTTARPIYLLGGYNYVLPNNPSIEIKPSTLIALTPGSKSFEASCLVEYKNKFWGGLNYNYQESIGIIAGVLFKQFMIGYSYDINVNQYKIGGTHEIRVGYCFKLEFEKALKIYRNTRFL
jgi:type IX secretion system PorP/SprF family membrane protein